MIFLINPWKDMSEEEKVKELLDIGIKEEVIKNKEAVKRVRGKQKLFNFLLIFFLLILSVAIAGYFLIKEDTKLIKINELRVIAGVAIIGIILLFLPEKKKPYNSNNYIYEG